MMSSSNPTRDAMADGISIRVRVRRAPSTAKLEYGEPQDMVCTIVNWEVQPPPRRTTTTRKSPRRRSVKSHARSSSMTGGPTLYFHLRTHSGHTLETCCSLQSVSSYDSMDDPSIISETAKGEEAGNEHNNNNKESSPVSDMVEKLNNRSRMMSAASNNNSNNKRKKAFSIPCGSIKTVERTSSLFRGYRIFFATGSRGAFDLEFENKNGSDIMMAFLQATLPGERFVHLNNGAGGSVDGSDTASYLSTLDVEKLTERLAEREHPESMSEKLRNGVAKVVSSLEDMSTSLCGGICCSGQFMSSSVAPYEPEEVYKRASSPPPSPSRHSSVAAHFGVFTEPVMEIDEEKSTQTDSDAFDSKDIDALRKRRYLREYQLPSGLSVELPPEPSSKYRLASV